MLSVEAQKKSSVSRADWGLLRQVQNVMDRLRELNLDAGVAPEIIRTALASEFAAGDVSKAATYANLMNKASQGIVCRTTQTCRWLVR